MVDPDQRLRALRERGLRRELRSLEPRPGGRAILDGREVLVLCSNDYLGLREHPAVLEAAAEAARRWGAGAGSSRLVSGNLALHTVLEQELADFKGHERSLLFGSGFLANTGVIPALTGPDEVILSDALNHASLIDGCRLSSAETIVYEHGELDSLAAGLERTAGRPALIVTDAVFSMDGDLAPLAGIVKLARSHGARVLVDEAHATGVVGPGGRGLVAELGLQHEVEVVIGTLSKALGSYGAFACCSQAIGELLVNQARTLIFSTALPPPSAAAALAALRLLRQEPGLVERLHANARLMRDGLGGAGLAVGGGEMPVVPLIAGEPAAAIQWSQAALSRGVFVQAIRPPTVPEGTSRLRLTVTAGHSEAELREAAGVLAATAPGV